MFLLLPVANSSLLKIYHSLPSPNDLLQQSPFFLVRIANLNEKAAPLGYDKAISNLDCPEPSKEKHFILEDQENSYLSNRAWLQTDLYFSNISVWS
ncbi:hypothetical protein CEXT_448931 [Caerostris extrusa]|uniref:Uncharacterized protein n=1 Tax=Caerostris extrusa TaxID=172846 RepID=A0AAV4QPQ6_CAEEX|nr:hypothetical protein CEXT_448931 [Caerostris extrusa]